MSDEHKAPDGFVKLTLVSSGEPVYIKRNTVTAVARFAENASGLSPSTIIPARTQVVIGRSEDLKDRLIWLVTESPEYVLGIK